MVARILVLAALCAAAIAGPAGADVRERLTEVFAGSGAVVFGSAIDLDRLRAAYQAEAFRPVWVDDAGATPGAETLLDLIERASEDGLEPADYRIGVSDIGHLSSEDELTALELALSDAFLDFGRDLNGGRTTPAISHPDIVIPRKTVNAAGWLAAAAEHGPGAVLGALAPRHRQYAQLRSMLAGYRALAERGGWPLVPAGEPMKPGVDDPRIPALRKNLTARGYDGIDGGAVPTIYDPDLEGVVRHFQRRHGLDVDGVIGPATYAALNVPAEERVRQIIVNMERWRWLPNRLGERYVLINQAHFVLEMVEGGTVVDRRRVIVGKPYHKSPMFSDAIKYAEFNPTWTPTQSIVRNEILPELQADPGYLERNDMSLFDGSGNRISPWSVDWPRVSRANFPFRIVQNPGEQNALGRVKFMFPNKFSVYLHDTPRRDLFERTGRAFSHGCIRVEGPLEFAEKLFATDLDRAAIDRLVASGKLTRVNLSEPVPVHLTYFTAWIDENGIPEFYEDIYGRDALVGQVIRGAV